MLSRRLYTLSTSYTTPYTSHTLELCISKLRLWLTTGVTPQNRNKRNGGFAMQFSTSSKRKWSFWWCFQEKQHQINHPQDDRLNSSTLTISMQMRMQKCSLLFWIVYLLTLKTVCTFWKWRISLSTSFGYYASICHKFSISNKWKCSSPKTIISWKQKWNKEKH